MSVWARRCRCFVPPRWEDREKQNRAPATAKQPEPNEGSCLFGGCWGSVLFFSVFPSGCCHVITHILIGRCRRRSRCPSRRRELERAEALVDTGSSQNGYGPKTKLKTRFRRRGSGSPQPAAWGSGSPQPGACSLGACSPGACSLEPGRADF